MTQRIAITTLILFLAACGGSGATGVEVAAKMSKQSKQAVAYQKTCDAALDSARKMVASLEAIEGERTVETALVPLNDLWMTIDSGMNRAGLYSAVHPDPSLREVAEGCELEFRKVVTNLGLSRPVYDAVAAVNVEAEDTVTKRYVDHLLRDFRRAGVDKDEPTRERIRALKDELVKIGQDFGKNIREDVRKIELNTVEELAGLPEDYVAKHQPGDDGKIVITTDYPEYIPFMTYADNDDLRLQLYREFRKRGYPANIEVLQTMLAKRYELAQLLGYENWAEYITEDKMIKSEEAAREFIEKIRDVAKARAKSDYDELLVRLKRDQPDAKAVGDWQKSYIQEKVKAEKFSYDPQQVREYFSYDKTREGLFALTSQMFGVQYKEVEADVWYQGVEAYEIVDNGETIGRFYLDMHPREDKYKHAAAFPIVTGVEGRQIPEAALVCNFPAEGPMEHNQVETFFHEFGHLIHHLFGGKHRWVGVSGFNTEWDFVEAPSQMLEEWAYDPSTLESFATNEAGEKIPAELVQAIRSARDFGKGLWVAHQMFYASVSLNYYDRNPTDLDTTAMMKELMQEYSPFDYVEDTYFQLSFGHLDGYSAIYYTYMWSLVIAKDMFSVFQEKGMLNPEAAKRYRDYILAPGGSKDAAEMVHDFLERDYTFDAFATWLNGA